MYACSSAARTALQIHLNIPVQLVPLYRYISTIPVQLVPLYRYISTILLGATHLRDFAVFFYY
jgi:hypothetical protein